MQIIAKLVGTKNARACTLILLGGFRFGRCETNPIGFLSERSLDERLIFSKKTVAELLGWIAAEMRAKGICN